MRGVSLKEYFERIIDDQKHAAELQFSANQREADATARSLETRLESMNEFRRQISDERALYVQRPLHDELKEQVDTLRRDQANMNGRLWAMGVGITVFLTIVGLTLRFFKF